MPSCMVYDVQFSLVYIFSVLIRVVVSLFSMKTLHWTRHFWDAMGCNYLSITKLQLCSRWCRNWPLFCVRSRGWIRHLARVGSPVAPRLRGGVSNHGSRRKNATNYHSTTIILVVAIKRPDLAESHNHHIHSITRTLRFQNQHLL